jgi:hypothetical protein
MINDFYDSKDELVRTENLSTFSVVEIFCAECMKMTPHHLDDEVLKALAEAENPDDNEEIIEVAPMSSKECVFCRGNEERWIMDID